MKKKLIGAVTLLAGALMCSAYAIGAPITLTVMSTTIVADPEMSAEQKIADAFMAENPDIKIEYIPVPYPDYSIKLATAAAGGAVPDIFANGPRICEQSR